MPLILSNFVQNLLSTETSRTIATVLALFACLGVGRLWTRLLERTNSFASPDLKRARLVWMKNFLWSVGTVVVVSIWASKIAGFALSLAAFAGAIIIVSKDLIICILGYFVIGLTKPFKIGQFIEVNGFSGRVIDMDLFFITLVETSSAKQLTGKTISVPNSLVISTGVRNMSATGEYIIDLYRITVPFDCDFKIAESSAISAAESATSSWMVLAEEHFKKIEDVDYIDLPSSRPKVLWEPLDSRGHVLTIRFACPVERRVSTEQEIFRRFWENYKNNFIGTKK